MDTSNDDSEAWLRRFTDPPSSVILAEDDADLREMIAMALRIDGFHVVEAHDGGELLDRISDWMLYRWPHDQLDLILSDVRMPGFSGTDVVASLRRSHWDTPVILMSAYDDPALKAQATKLGISSVFSKPFDIDDLRTAVANTVTRQRATPSSSRFQDYEDEFDVLDREIVARRRKH
jgi:CheY-like chemotaxis protein